MDPTDVVYDTSRHYIADSANVLGSELSARLTGYVRSRSIKDLVEVSSLFDPAKHGWTVLKTLLQVEALFKKCEHFSDEERCRAAAKQGFLDSEAICKQTNDRLDNHLQPGSNTHVGEVERMVRFIDHVLGPRELFLDSLPSLVRATNGATATRPRSKSGHVARLARSMYATERSHIYLKSLATFWGYKINPRKIHHNRVELVPKNWKTHRTIACEPEGNLFLQIACDAYIKSRLRKKSKIDLRDQSLNQRLAHKGSLDGFLATIDLKAASDRLSLNVVHLLFSREWVDFFLDTRSPFWKDEEGALVPYHKLSSMGNGYTFTVETLVFAAACSAVGSKEFSVYGDDIIIESELYHSLVALLSYLGFEVNEEKSHAEYDNVVANRRGPEDLDDRLELKTSTVYIRRLLGGGLRNFESLAGNRPIRISGPLLAGCRPNSDFSFSAYAGRCRGVPPSFSDGFGPHVGLRHGEHGLVELNLPVLRKSSFSGTYRESCGLHFYGGHDITPRYVKSLRTRRDWVLMVNNITYFAPMGGATWKYAIGIVRKLNLPLVPPNLDPCSGVFIDVHACYRLRLIRSVKRFGPYVPGFRALIPRAKEVRAYDSRALFLWFLHRKETPYESSRYSLGTTKCRSKWVRYYPVRDSLMGGPVRLHWWTEALLSSNRQ